MNSNKNNDLFIKKQIKRLMIGICKIVYLYIPIRRLNRFLKDKRSAIYIYWVRNSFKHCPLSVSFGKIGCFHDTEYISIGENCGFGDFIYLTAWQEYHGEHFAPELTIGNNCDFGAYNHITCINRVEIGDNCLTGKWVTISDNNHGTTDFDTLHEAPIKRKLYTKGPVIIGNNVWIGDKVTILSGVTIGDGAVIAANSVVTKDIPSYCVAAGVPVKIFQIKNR